MKALKLLLIWILVLIVVVVVGLVVFIKTFDVNRLKPQIVGQASSLLKRPVDFSSIKLALSLKDGISLKIADLKIGEDPAFGNEPFLTVRDAAAGVDLLGFLTRRELTVTDIRIESPRIAIIRDKDGRLNVESVAKAPPAGRDAAVEPSAPQSAPSSAALPALFVQSVAATDGRVTFIDRTFTPPLEAQIDGLAVSITDFSLRDRFPFSVEAAVLGNDKNLKVEGQARINAAAQEVSVTGLKTTVELHKISMEKVGKALPMLKADALPSDVRGVVVMTIRELTAGAQGISGLEADASLAAGSLKLKNLKAPLSDIAVRAVITADKATLDAFSCGIAGGTVTATGEVEDYLRTQDYAFDCRAENIRLQDLLVPGQAPVKPEGLLSMKARVAGKGFTSDALRRTLSGTADIGVTKGMLRDFNVLQAVLDKIEIIPGLAQKVHDKLPDQFKKKLEQKDTALSDVSVPVVIENGALIIRDAQIGADDFMYKGAGEADFAGGYKVEGEFLVLRELSAAMADGVNELKYLFNADGMIALPLKVTGSSERQKLYVDAGYMAKKLITTQAGGQLMDVINKALGGDKEQPAGEAGQQSQGSASSSNDIGQAVGSLLEGILGGQR